MGTCPRPRGRVWQPWGGVSVGGWAAAGAVRSEEESGRMIPQEPPSSLRMTIPQAAVGTRKHVRGWANRSSRGSAGRGPAPQRRIWLCLVLSCLVSPRHRRGPMGTPRPSDGATRQVSSGGTKQATTAHSLDLLFLEPKWQRCNERCTNDARTMFTTFDLRLYVFSYAII